jgi:hypothetical protein
MSEKEKEKKRKKKGALNLFFVKAFGSSRLNVI